MNAVSFIERYQPIAPTPRRRNMAIRAYLPWLPHDYSTLSRLAEEGATARAIGNALRRTATAIRARARLHGIVIAPAWAVKAREVPDPTEVDEIGPVRLIIQATAENYGLTHEDIVGRCKYAEVALARQEAMWLAARDTKKVLTVIAAVFKRHHATIIHGVRRENQRRGADVRGLGTHRRSKSGSAVR